MHVLTFTIGRNIGMSPMSEVLWATFTDRVHETLVRFVADYDATVEEHYGKGMWQGIEEESYKVTALIDPDLLHNPHRAPWLRDLTASVAAIAYGYGQDAVAFTIGRSELISMTSPYQHSGFEVGAL
jgi:hypothetical protein